MGKGGRQEQGILFFSMKKETTIIKWEQFFGTPNNSISS
jgi:hypothetical protein